MDHGNPNRRPSMFKTGTNSKPNPVPSDMPPKQVSVGSISVHQYTPTPSQPDEEDQTSKPKFDKVRFVVFTSVVAVILILLGVCLLLVGIVYELRDFKVLGPGCIVLGVIVLSAAVFIVLRYLCSNRKVSTDAIALARERQQSIVESQGTGMAAPTEHYIIPPLESSDGKPGSPPGKQLYGGKSPKRKKRFSIYPEDDAELCATNDSQDFKMDYAPPPIVSVPNEDVEIKKIIIANDKNKPAPENENSGHFESAEDRPNSGNKIK